MESLLVSQFENTRISMKPKLGFIKDAPKVSKYSVRTYYYYIPL